MATLYLGFGSNLGDKSENLRNAIERLPLSILVTEVSPVYETEPMLVTDQPRFYNLVLGAETELLPQEVLAEVKHIEYEMGREEGVRYGPRLIDLDILFYDDLVLESLELTVPHPRIAERAFVLAPLADIAPDLAHPVLKKTVRELLAAIPNVDVQVKKTEIIL